MVLLEFLDFGMISKSRKFNILIKQMVSFFLFDSFHFLDVEACLAEQASQPASQPTSWLAGQLAGLKSQTSNKHEHK